MQRETIDKSNEILRKINGFKNEIEIMEKCAKTGIPMGIDIVFGGFNEYVVLDTDEFNLIIAHKKECIQALEKELEEL